MRLPHTRPLHVGEDIGRRSDLSALGAPRTMSFRVASISTLRRLRARAADVAKEQDAPRTASCRSRSRAGTRRAVAGPTSRRPADGDAQRGSRRHGARDERLEKRPVNNSRQSAPGSSDPALQTDAVGAGGEQDSARSLGRDLGDPLWVGLVLGNRDRHSITPGHRGSVYRTIGVRWGGVFPVFSLRTSTNRHMGVQPTRLSVLAPISHRFAGLKSRDRAMVTRPLAADFSSPSCDLSADITNSQASQFPTVHATRRGGAVKETSRRT